MEDKKLLWKIDGIVIAEAVPCEIPYEHKELEERIINAKELRIGNWLNIIGKVPIQIDAQRILSIEKGDDQYKPIPITKDWLLRTNLPHEKFDRFTLFENDAFSLYCSAHTSLGFQIWFENAFDECPLEVNYLHELQNLYFALTKKELAFNPPKPD